MPDFAVVPKIYTELGWSNHAQPTTQTWTSPGGTVTIGNEKLGAPFRHDRDIVLYLAEIGRHSYSGIAYGSIRDLRRWLGANRRQADVLQRLKRVFGCRVMRQNATGKHESLIFGHLLDMDGDRFVVKLGEEFHRQCSAGKFYAKELASQLRAHPTALDVYLGVLWFIDEVRNFPEFTHEYRPYATYRSPRASFKARATLRKALAFIADAIPGVLMEMPDERATILIDFGERKCKPAPEGETPAQRRERKRLEREERSMIPELRRQNARLQQLIELTDRQLEESPVRWKQAMARLDKAEAASKIALDAVDRFNIYVDHVEQARKRQHPPAATAPRATAKPRGHSPPRSSATETARQAWQMMIENYQPPDPADMTPIERGVHLATAKLARGLGVATARAHLLWKKWRGGK